MRTQEIQVPGLIVDEVTGILMKANEFCLPFVRPFRPCSFTTTMVGVGQDRPSELNRPLYHRRRYPPSRCRKDCASLSADVRAPRICWVRMNLWTQCQLQCEKVKDLLLETLQKNQNSHPFPRDVVPFPCPYVHPHHVGAKNVHMFFPEPFVFFAVALGVIAAGIGQTPFQLDLHHLNCRRPSDPTFVSFTSKSLGVLGDARASATFCSRGIFTTLMLYCRTASCTHKSLT